MTCSKEWLCSHYQIEIFFIKVKAAFLDPILPPVMMGGEINIGSYHFDGKYLDLILIRENTYEICCCDFMFRDCTSSNSEISFVELAFVEKEVKWQ